MAKVALSKPHSLIPLALSFSSQIAPYASLILNGIYWDARFPRLLTKQQLKDTTRSPLISLSDVSADPNGSIELVTRCTKIEDPFLLWDAQKMEETQSDEYEKKKDEDNFALDVNLSCVVVVFFCF